MNRTLSYRSVTDHKELLNPNQFKFIPTNPSEQYRLNNYAFPNLLASLHRQNILTDNPSNVIFYSGLSGISSDPYIELPNTGECFNFLESEANVYKDVAHGSVADQRECHKQKSSQPPPKLTKNHSKVDDESNKELFYSIKSKLSEFTLRGHPCELCSKNGQKSLFDNEGQSTFKESSGLKLVEPCPHSSFKNVPKIYPISKFDETFENESQSGNDTTYSKLNKPDTNGKYPLRERNLNINEVNVDHLLTYKSKNKELNPNETKQYFDICKFVEDKKSINDLSPVLTSSLRKVALELDELKENESYPFNQESLREHKKTPKLVVTFKGPVEDKNLELWKYPNCLENKREQGPLPSPRKEEETKEQPNQEEDSFKEIEEYLKSNVSLETMKQKYVQLMKSECPKEILKALKHVICIKLKKEKLYYKGADHKFTSGVSQEDLFDQILKNINDSYETQDLKNFRDDDSTDYTYSSLSLSTYDSVVEEFTHPITENDYFNEDPDTIHSNTLDAYGWLTVSEENVRGNQHKILYCELVGTEFSFYSASHKENFKSIKSNKSFKTLNFDNILTITKRIHTKNNKRSIRLQYTQDTKSTNVPVPREGKDDLTNYFLRLETDTQNELSNWFTFLLSRSLIRPFFTLLNDYRVNPLNNTLFYLLYPKRKELIFNRLAYHMDCEEQIYQMFIKQPLQYMDFSSRSMTDNDLIHHLTKWEQPVFTANFSLNKLTLSSDPQILIDYIVKNKIQKLFLDKNPLHEYFFTDVLPLVALKTGLKYISLKGCTLYESLMATLKKINKLKQKGELVMDFRQCNLTPEFENFATGYPLNHIEIVIRNSPSYLQEYEMEYFIDNKSLPEISILGSFISGRLLSNQPKIRKHFKWPLFCRRNEEAIDVYFEFRAPYLVWYNWFPKNQILSFTKKEQTKEENFKLTESQAIFVRDIKVVMKDSVDWIVIQGKIPDKFKVQSRDMKIVVKGYNQKGTKRWLEILSRWVAGITYVSYLQNHPGIVPSKHILSFCSRIDTPELVMNGFPCERKLMMRFLSYLSEQSSLKSLNFSNMGLDSVKLSFDKCVLKNLKLDNLDWSFNQIELEVENLWLLNAILPKVEAKYYNISHNPLGDTLESSKLFFRVLRLNPRKISFNHCKLSSVFISRLKGALSKFEGTFESLETIELEGNEFTYEEMKEFVEILKDKFPNLTDLRLYGSLEEETEEEIRQLDPICNFEKVSKDEPEIGSFKKVLHVKKEKRTTRKSFLQNTDTPPTQF